MKAIKRFAFQYLYISILIPTTFFCVADWKFNLLSNLVEIDTILIDFANMSGIFIGFILTAATVFLGMPKDTEYMKKVKKYRHHIIFAKICKLAVIFFLVSLACWLLQTPFVRLTAYSFMLGLSEVIAAFYYVIKLSVDNL